MAKHTFRTKKGLRVDFTNAEEIIKDQPNFLDIASDSNDWDEIAAFMEGTATINFKRILTADVELYFDEETGEEYLDVYVTSSLLASEEATPELAEEYGEKIIMSTSLDMTEKIQAGEWIEVYDSVADQGAAGKVTNVTPNEIEFEKWPLGFNKQLCFMKIVQGDVFKIKETAEPERPEKQMNWERVTEDDYRTYQYMKVTQKQFFVLRFLNNYPGSTPHLIADKLDIGLSQARFFITSLMKKGLVKRVDDKFPIKSLIADKIKGYSLTKFAHDLLEEAMKEAKR